MDVERTLAAKEPDENSLLEQYFDYHYNWLKTIPLSEVPYKVKHGIACIFYGPTYDMDWKEFADELGLKGDIIINAIECESKSDRIPALCTVFKYLPLMGFGKVMKQFSERKKFHILKYVKPYVEELLEKKNIVQPTAPHLSQEYNCIGSNPGGSKDIVPALGRSCVETSVNEKFQVVPPRSLITVFIQHPLSEEGPAQKLANALLKSGMRVILSKDLFPFLLVNSHQTLESLIKKVDFIIPIISEELLKQISSRKTKVECGYDLETSSNRYLYDLLSREYYETCKNYRVRPVIDRSKFKGRIQSSLLSSPFRLWEDVPFLVDNLKGTKKLLQL